MSKNTIVRGCLVPSLKNKPLDGRQDVPTLSDIKNIENPYVNFIFPVAETGKWYKVVSLTDKVIDDLVIPNGEIAKYELFGEGLTEEEKEQFLTKQFAENKYLGKQDAENKYLGKQDAENKYLGKQDAENKYLDKEDAENKYLGKEDAENDYLGKEDAENKYLNKQDANNEYLSKKEASETYQIKGEDGVTYDEIGDVDLDGVIDETDVEYEELGEVPEVDFDKLS